MVLIEATFWSLALTAVCLWRPGLGAIPGASRFWLVPTAVAVACAAAGGMVDARGVLALVVLAAAGHAAGRATQAAVRVTAHVVFLVLCAALFLHVVPGFRNPVVLDRVVLGPDAVPYSQYLNVDKGVAGLIVLGLYVPGMVQRDQLARRAGGALWRFLAVAGAVVVVSLLLGYVRWDPKAPAWWPMWLGIMLVLTALPEEAVFRGVIQTALARRFGERWAIAGGGLLFGVAHLAGGASYVVAASVAGIGYGWIRASTGSIAAAVLAHAGVNAIHFFCFTYPALAR